MLALALLLAHAASAAAPAFDAGIHGYTGAAGGVVLDMPLDQAGRTGVALMGWPARFLGLGVRLDGGSYGLYGGDMGNAFAFAESQIRIDDRWTVGAGIGTPVAWVDYYCDGPCGGEMLWEYHHPIAALTGTYHVEKGLLHIPISLRGEASAARWAVGIDVGVGLRIHRGS